VFTPYASPPKKRRSPTKTARILNKDASETADARHGKNNAPKNLARAMAQRKQKGKKHLNAGASAGWR
jgi:hypothetical protein